MNQRDISRIFVDRSSRSSKQPCVTVDYNSVSLCGFVCLYMCFKYGSGWVNECRSDMQNDHPIRGLYVFEPGLWNS